MAAKPLDIVFKNARICVPGKGFVQERSLGVRDGKVTAIFNDLDVNGAKEIVDVDGRVLTAGLIDIHTHIYHKANQASVDPLPTVRRSGASTLVDAGTAGASSFRGFVDYVVAACPARLLAFVNISYAGIFGFHPAIEVGEATEPRLLHIVLCREAVEQFREHVVAIKIRIGKGESGENGDLALDRALEAADKLGVPVMAHVGLPPMGLEALSAKLLTGDILTHCYRGGENAPLADSSGKARDCVVDARDSGILFDIGHGMGSFSLYSARGMLSDGFPPDTISSDVHRFCVDGPAKDLLHVASKFLALGIGLEDVINMINMMTINAARAIQRPKLGTLSIGAAADLTVLDVLDEAIDFHDFDGNSFVGKQMIVSHQVYVSGLLL